jgi:hypothetical protein
MPFFYSPHAIVAKAKDSPVKGAPNCVVNPLEPGTPVPVVWHGALLPNVERGANGLEEGITARGVGVIRGNDGFVVRATDGGLRPPTPSSVAPSGIPTRPTDGTEPIPVGDEAVDAAGPAKELLPNVGQVPDAVPVMLMPPPSNGKVELDVPMPDVVPMLELTAPKDACGIEPPMPEHVVMLPVVAPIGDAPIGLTPGDASSVAPRGMPAGATREPGPMPSGDVMPSGEGPGVMPIPPICADAEPQPHRTAVIATINKRVIAGFSISLWTLCALLSDFPHNKI